MSSSFSYCSLALSSSLLAFFSAIGCSSVPPLPSLRSRYRTRSSSEPGGATSVLLPLVGEVVSASLSFLPFLSFGGPAGSSESLRSPGGRSAKSASGAFSGGDQGGSVTGALLNFFFGFRQARRMLAVTHFMSNRVPSSNFHSER